MLTGPGALVHPERDETGVPIPALGEIEERVQVAAAEGQPAPRADPRPGHMTGDGRPGV